MGQESIASVYIRTFGKMSQGLSNKVVFGVGQSVPTKKSGNLCTHKFRQTRDSISRVRSRHWRSSHRDDALSRRQERTRRLMEVVRHGRVDLSPLITHTFP